MADKEARGTLIGVFGEFNARALIEIRTEDALRMVDAGEVDPVQAFMLDAVEAELAELAEREPDVSVSTSAALAKSLAYRIANPYTSATATAACSKELRETMSELRAMAPEAEEEDELERHRRERADRLARQSAAGTSSSS